MSRQVHLNAKEQLVGAVLDYICAAENLTLCCETSQLRTIDDQALLDALDTLRAHAVILAGNIAMIDTVRDGRVT